MKQLSRKLTDYLPRKHKYNNPVDILYLVRDDELRAIYSYDSIKTVAYTSDINQEEFNYMSLFEIFYDGWELTSKEKAFERLIPPQIFDIPF